MTSYQLFNSFNYCPLGVAKSSSNSKSTLRKWNFSANMHYDLVVLDIKMPNIDGIKLYHQLRKVDKNVKVCFITASEEYYIERFPDCQQSFLLFYLDEVLTLSIETDPFLQVGYLQSHDVPQALKAEKI